MFLVDEAAADAIRRAWNERGELAAIVELKRHFPGISDHANALRCVHTIVSWQRLPDSDGETGREPRAAIGVGVVSTKTDCPLCWGYGAAFRETAKGRLWEWPCPYMCQAPRTCIAVNARRLP